MLTPILATKLYRPPPRPQVVLRPNLIERLNAGLRQDRDLGQNHGFGRKLTLISAPAGFGKTTLVSEWAAVCRRPVAWLSLDEGDNDPTCFLTYLIASLQTVAPKIGEGILRILQAPQSQPPPIESLVTTLLNEINTISDNFVLVLDDYHVLDAKAIDKALSFLIEHMPPQLRLVIATREDPPFPLARWRVRGQLTELRAADLRFTPAEAAEFLNQVMGLNLSANDITSLENRTEGWIAGLQLAALSMQGHQDTASFIQSFTGSHHFVLDYLLEEVLQQQSESVQTFLLRTSILGRLCGPLCDAVCSTGTGLLGDKDLHPTPFVSGQETLEYLEHANLFIVALDNERRWYRYHHLFGDLLRQRLGQSLSPGKTADLHISASKWYEKNNDVAEAFLHACIAGDFGRAATLTEMAWEGMDANFQTRAWLGWVKKLPNEMISIRPVLSVQIASALTDAGELEASEARLRDAERCLDNPPDGLVVVAKTLLKSLPAMIALIHANNAQDQGDLSAAVKYAEMALQLIPEEDYLRRAQATVTFGCTHWAKGDLEKAHGAFVEWIDKLQKSGNIVFAVASAFALADIQVSQGHLQEAVKTYQQSLQLASTSENDVQTIIAHHYLGLAMLFHEMGDQAVTEQYLQKCRDLGEKSSLIDWPFRWRLAQGRLKEAAGDLDEALELLDEARRVYVRNPLPNLQPINALKARVHIKQGMLTKAWDWVHDRGLSVDDDLSYLREFEHITLARLLIVQFSDNSAERSILPAMALLERLLKAADAGHRIGSQIEILILQALARQAQGNIPSALVSLKRALLLAEPEGYVRLFVGYGSQVEKLLTRLQAEGCVMNDYLPKVLTAFTNPNGVHLAVPKVPQPLVEALSQRELEVLKLAAQGLSNLQIGRQLFLALSTVKGHNRNIFAKLNVENRTQAVYKARTLNLIPPQ